MATSPSAFVAPFVALPDTYSQLGILAENYPNFFAATISGALTSGTIYVQRLALPGPITVTNILTGVATAGVTLTAAQNFAGLYDASGNQIGVTADQSGTWTSTGVKTMALTGGPFAVNQPFVFAAYLANGTTPPLFARGAGAGIGSPIVNLGASGATMATASNGTLATALPGSLVYASNSAAGSPQHIWTGLS